MDWIAPSWPARGDGRIAKDRHLGHARCDFLEQFEPLSADAVFKDGKAGGVAARARQALDVAAPDGVGDLHEYDRYVAGLLQRQGRGCAASGHDEVWREGNELRGVATHPAGIPARPTELDPHITAVSPSQLLQSLQ